MTAGTSFLQPWRQQAHEAQLGIQRAVSVTAALASPLPTGAGSDGEDDEGDRSAWKPCLRRLDGVELPRRRCDVIT